MNYQVLSILTTLYNNNNNNINIQQYSTALISKQVGKPVPDLSKEITDSLLPVTVCFTLLWTSAFSTISSNYQHSCQL